MKTVYLYVMDTMADWEIGHILQGINLQKYLKEPEYCVKTVGVKKEQIKTMCGMTIIPDCVIDEIDEENICAILLPGGDTWNEEGQKAILDKVEKWNAKGIMIGAICGATLAIAERGLLDKCLHTSNTIEFLCGLSKNYKGKDYYRNEVAMSDKNIITASSAGGISWAKKIMEYLNMYSEKTIDSWYKYNTTGDVKYFYESVKEFQ